jgi:dimethylamine/trimethylamine dehydrogenase
MAGDTATLTRTGEVAGNRRNPRYDILFEPVKIGPVTAPNRFYQVPHASGMTNALPRVRAQFREDEGRGRWGVVCTGACSIHPTSMTARCPSRGSGTRRYPVARADDRGGASPWQPRRDRALAWRRLDLQPHQPPGRRSRRRHPWMATHVGFMSNLRPKVMDRGDILDLLRWQAEGRAKARSAGFDIVYVYAGMGICPTSSCCRIQPAQRRIRRQRRQPRAPGAADDRGDQGGGRRYLRRRAAHQPRGAAGQASPHAESEAHEVIDRLKDLPDLFDVKMDSSPTDCSASRFSEKAATRR